MPIELDASFRQMHYSAAEVGSTGPDHFPKYNCHLVFSYLLQFTKISLWLLFIILVRDWQLILQLCSPLLT